MTPRRQHRAPAGAADAEAPGPAPEGAATADAILAPFPEPVRLVADRVRSLVRRTLPTVRERPYPGWRGVGFRDPHAGYVVGLFPQQDRVDLVFEHGARLADPDGLFEPPGTRRQVRLVALRSPGDVDRPALAALLRRAVVEGSV